VDETVDTVDACSLQRDLANIHLRGVPRTEHSAPDAGAAGIGGQRRTGITVGWHGHVLNAERLRHRYGESKSARLERAGREVAFARARGYEARPPGSAPRSPSIRDA